MSAGLHLIVTLAGDRVALPASDIDSVVEIEDLTPVPLAPPHVAGLAALRSRVLTVIDGRVALGLAPTAMARPCEAVMLEHGGHAYALLVDAIVDAVELDEVIATPAPVTGIWTGIAVGIADHAGSTIPVIGPAALIETGSH